MTEKPTRRFEVANLEQWGRLVKSWATGLDYISQADAKQPPRDYWVKHWPTQVGRTPAPKTIEDKGQPWCLPPGKPVDIHSTGVGSINHQLPFAVAMTKQEFEARVTKAGVSITDFPPKVEKVIVVQGSPDTMVLRLPPKDILQDTEDDMLNNVKFNMLPFYWALFGKGPRMPTEQADIMELQANRIGEYTMNNCGG